MKFAISSCWNSHRHDDGYAMIKELADLGFRYVELSHGTRLSLVPGILKAVSEGVVKVASVHNFCPLPVGVMGAAPNLYEPSAPGRRERILWMHNTLRTIDFAQRVDCDRVVLHSGHVRFLLSDPEAALKKAMEAAGQEGAYSAGMIRARQFGLQRLRRVGRAYMKRLEESFSHVAENARKAGIRLGVENREGFDELPLDEEMAAFQERLKEHEVFGYWHDAGHARLKERLGLLQHGEFLGKLRPYLIGFHLHDVSAEGRDHQVPGSGTIDWSVIAGAVQPGDVVVMEMSPRLEADQIRTGRSFLLKLLPGLEA